MSRQINPHLNNSITTIDRTSQSITSLAMEDLEGDSRWERWNEVLCRACGWKRLFQETSFYSPSLRVIYGAGRRGAWTIGEKYLLKEVQTDDPWDEQPLFNAPSIELVSKHTTIPVPEIVRTWEDGNRFYTFMTRIPGSTLKSIYSTLTSEEKDHYAQEVADYILQLRKLTSSKPETANGRRVRDGFFDRGALAGSRPDDWFGHFNGTDIQRKECLDTWPAMEPFTFSHTDLTPGNIIVHNGHVSGIIDWDEGGYYPVWLEYVRLRSSPQYNYWTSRIANILDRNPETAFPEAFDFYTKYHHLFERKKSSAEKYQWPPKPLEYPAR